MNNIGLEPHNFSSIYSGQTTLRIGNNETTRFTLLMFTKKIPNFSMVTASSRKSIWVPTSRNGVF